MLPAGANRNTALHGGQITQSAQRAPGNTTNRPQATPYQAVPQQPYQSRQSPHVYQYAKKRVYQIDGDPTSEFDEEDGNVESSYFTNKGFEEL